MTTTPLPPARYIGSERVMEVLAAHGRERLELLNPLRVLALAVLAGAFITTGAFLSMMLASDVEGEGAIKLVEGLGFSAGFFFVILSGAVLFTETNVVLPAVLIRRRRDGQRDGRRSGGLRVGGVLRFWSIAWVGNLVGSLLLAAMLAISVDLSASAGTLLAETIETKTVAAGHGAAGWWSVVVSGVVANWLVGMAAFFATMGRTIFGKYIPVLLAVTAFVAAGVQHSPANMGFFALQSAFAGRLDWGEALLWNLLPAGLGNIIGGGIAVAALLSWAYARYDPLQQPATPSEGPPS